MKFKVLHKMKNDKKLRIISIVVMCLMLITGVTTYTIVMEKNKTRRGS